MQVEFNDGESTFQDEDKSLEILREVATVVEACNTLLVKQHELPLRLRCECHTYGPDMPLSNTRAARCKNELIKQMAALCNDQPPEKVSALFESEGYSDTVLNGKAVVMRVLVEGDKEWC